MIKQKINDMNPFGTSYMSEPSFMSEQAFYASSFKAMLEQKIKAYRAANGLPDKGSVPRYAPPRNGAPRFYGVRLSEEGE